MVDAFSNKTFIDEISQSLQAICQLVIKAAINEAVARAVSKLELDVIKLLKEQSHFLRETVKQNDEAIIAKDELLNLRNDTIANLERNVEQLSEKLDNLEQYGRRSSVRMFNVPQLPDQPCDDAALKIINELIGDNVSEADIERCHTVDKPNAQANRRIIIKFKSYQYKAEVYKAKTKLKENPDKIILTEDLTKKNHFIVQNLLELRKKGNIILFGQLMPNKC